jgi:hypothetical protein
MLLDRHPDLATAIEAAFAAEVIASWVEEGNQYLAGRGLSEPDAGTAMYALLTALEGGFLLARAQRDVEPLLAAGRAVSTYVATLPVAARA